MATKLKDVTQNIIPNLPNNTQPKVTNPTAPYKETAPVPKPSTSATPSSTPTYGSRIKRDKTTGIKNGIIAPDGTVYSGLSPEKVDQLARIFASDTSLPPGSTFADTPTPLTHEQQVLADYNQKKADEALIAAQTPPNVTADQLSQVGNTSNLGIPTATGVGGMFEPTTADIINNLQRLQTENTVGLGLTPNKFTALASKIPIVGSALLDIVGQNKAVRDYIQDYSNENNFKSIKNDIQNAQNNLRLAITEANQPGNSQNAITDYNKALARLNQSVAQMKMIEKGDQRAYVDDIKNKRVELENYLQYNVPELNNKMRNALLKPDPNYYDVEVAKIVGGANGGN